MLPAIAGVRMLHHLLYYFGSNKLHKAAQRGDLPRMRKLIEKGADVNAPGPQGATPLFFTANTGSVQAAKLLLDHGAKVDHSVAEGGTALHSALLKQHEDLSIFLIENGADTSKATRPGITPLHLAALGCMPAVMGRIVREGADIRAVTAQGQCVLYCAMAGMTLRGVDDASCLRLLFAAGADPGAGFKTLQANLAGFSEAAREALREELENLIQTTDDPEKSRTANFLLAEMTGCLHSALAGELQRETESHLRDWWRSAPMAFPFWDGREIPVVYVFLPEEDPDFLGVADAALANFRKLTREDRLALTPLLREDCREICEATDFGPEGEAWEKRWFGPDGDANIWADVTPPDEIHVQRRDRRDKDIYVHMDMDCLWEEEHGLMFAFRRGRRLTRLSRQDGWLTDADAFGLADSEDELLSRFNQKAGK